MRVYWPAEHTRIWSRRPFGKRIFFVLLLVVSLSSVLICIHQILHWKQSYKIVNSTNITSSRYFKYPKRHNMSECPTYFGKVTIFIAYSLYNSSHLKHGYYATAHRSLECYLRTVNYTLLLVDLDTDPLVNESCSQHHSVFYKKHCAVLQYLPQTDWMLVLDADTGVVNPNHCIEEWIDDRVSVLLIERFFNWEFSAGNYLIKNSPFGRQFLRAWTDFEFRQNSHTWHGHDQGGLMMVVLELLIPAAEHERGICEHFWRVATNYHTYLKMITCVRIAIGAKRFWPGKIRILNRAHGFVRDGWISNQTWASVDFMLHGWKAIPRQKANPFRTPINPEECGVGLRGWNWLESKRKTVKQLRQILEGSERFYRSLYPSYARIIPFLDFFNVSSCYPYCETIWYCKTTMC